jgi:hypothetical protein
VRFFVRCLNIYYIPVTRKWFNNRATFPQDRRFKTSPAAGKRPVGDSRRPDRELRWLAAAKTPRLNLGNACSQKCCQVVHFMILIYDIAWLATLRRRAHQ